ncbi:Por secretion system C-terminal sorting domain-containing protein [Spirosomataceae bacterium TFI 002]|nr:Por secretion system C-terminal sorting domain-containing protein [Spirosomataceae bacterium TFI 002]
MTKLLKILGFSLFCSLTILTSLAQECNDSFSASFQLSSSNRTINWDQFGKIDLPFTMVYGGPIFDGNKTRPLSHGFTHLSDYNAFAAIPASQRALIYYGVAFPNQNQPWETIRSPWNNNETIYSQKWDKDHQDFANGLPENTGKIEADIMLFDIERQWRSDFDILQLKGNSNIDNQYNNLSNESFLATYKRDLREQYTKPLVRFRNLGYGSNTKVSSYSDAPIWNVFSNITGYSWNDWQKSQAPLNYLLQNDQGGVGGSFNDELDFMAPSAYYYYDYPHPFAGEYLSYLLFQIEANKARTSKKVIPFVWLRYSFTPDYQNQFIRPWMAEATAIFPFFSGADGLWLWENPFNFTNDENFKTYEYFLKGLKRISAYNSMFTGDYELVIEESARDLNESKKPVWRGVVKDNLFLVAAHNPFAKDENEKTNILVSYKNFTKSIQLNGYETALCLYDLNVLAIDEPDGHEFQIFPNPTLERVRIIFNSKTVEKLNVLIHSTNGVLLQQQEYKPIVGANKFELNIPKIDAKVLLISVFQSGETYSRKIVIQ